MIYSLVIFCTKRICKNKEHFFFNQYNLVQQFTKYTKHDTCLGTTVHPWWRSCGCYDIFWRLGHEIKKALSHQLTLLIFTKKKKKSHAPRQILSLGKHMKCMHFSDDMVFSLAIIIFLFFSDENQDIYFPIYKIKK